MHELSIAMGIINIAEEQAVKAGATTVDEIEIEVGALAGVVIDALEFAFDVAVRDTILEGATMRIVTIPARGRCADCGCEFDIENFLSQCPRCEGYSVGIVRGEELRVKSLTVD